MYTRNGSTTTYFRPAIINGEAYKFEKENLLVLAEKYSVKLKLNSTKTQERNYTRCHQMYQFPVFCADGNIYTCCDNKGNPKFSIGNWDQGDFRNLWLGKRHHDIYNSVNTKLCPPCRPNLSNIKIQNVLDNPELMEVLYI